MDKKLFSRGEVKKFAKDFVSYLKKKHKLSVAQAFLFGSYAKKTSRNWSDIDVCIVSEKFARVDPLLYLWTRRRDIDIEHGIEPYGIAPDGFTEENPIASQVKKFGISLK